MKQETKNNVSACIVIFIVLSLTLSVAIAGTVIIITEAERFVIKTVENSRTPQGGQ